MGRVRKYKKFKACDPFSKRGKTEVDTVHDEPPDIHDEKARKLQLKKDRIWENEDQRESFLSRDALRVTKDISSNTKKAEKAIEKRPEESMRDFTQRVRQETRITLKDELRALSSSRQKRKQKLKERTNEKKQKLRNSSDSSKDIQDIEREFSSSADGHLRPSDLEGPSSFAVQEPIAFGETLNQLPDLNKWKAALTKKMTKQQVEGTAAGGGGGTLYVVTKDHNNNNYNNNAVGSSSRKVVTGNASTTDNAAAGDDNANINVLKHPKKSRIRETELQQLNDDNIFNKRIKITDMMNSDDSVSGSCYSSAFFLESDKFNIKKSSTNNLNNKTKKTNNATHSRTLNARDIDNLREQSKIAYAQLKLSRQTR